MNELSGTPPPSEIKIELDSQPSRKPGLPLTEPAFPQKQLEKIPETEPGSIGIQRRVRSRSRRTLLLALILLILIAGAIGTYLPIAINNAASQQATATANVNTRATVLAEERATATAEAPIIATANARATVTAAFNAYNNAVAANGIMFGFDAQHTRFNTVGNYLSSSPAVANGAVYVGSGDQNLYAFHLPGTTL